MEEHIENRDEPCSQELLNQRPAGSKEPSPGVKRNQRRQRNNAGMGENCSGSRIAVFLAVFFFLTTAALVGYVIWKELSPPPKDTPQSIIQKYPHLFRTPEEQRSFEERYFNRSYKPVNTTVNNGIRCTVDCFFTEGSAPGRLVSTQVLHHACCQSNAFFKADDYMTNVHGLQKKIAQFQSHKQYFKFEECSHVVGFSYGQCQQQQGEYTTAVAEVDDDDDDVTYQVEWVSVSGCCKCLNTDPLPTQG